MRLYAAVCSAVITAREQQADPYAAVEAVLLWPTFLRTVAEADQLAQSAEFDYLDHLSYKDQANPAGGLNLSTPTIVLWNMLVLKQAVATLQTQRTPLSDAELQHLAPLAWENDRQAGGVL